MNIIKIGDCILVYHVVGKRQGPSTVYLYAFTFIALRKTLARNAMNKINKLSENGVRLLGRAMVVVTWRKCRFSPKPRAKINASAQGAVWRWAKINKYSKTERSD